ncbi:MAG TPA: hypothetical protein VF057_11190 [Thermoanaerobaculia bacterium]
MRVSAIHIAVVSMFAVSAHAAVFPEPIHIVREVHESITSSTVTIHEYCAGERMLSIAGGRVVITDFQRQEVTEIDANANTFSITSFADLARGTAAFAATARQSTASIGEARATGTKRAADGRTIETFEFSSVAGGESIHITVGIDRTTTLPASAIEALIGASYPNRRGVAHDAMLTAAGRGRTRTETEAVRNADRLPLPSAYEIRYSLGAETIVSRSTIVRVDRALAPQDLLMIPFGAQQVESRSVAAPRILDDIEGRRPPSSRD